MKTDQICIIVFFTHTAGMVSAEDEDDMPYDMYTQEVEVRKAAAGSKTSSSEDREEDSDHRAREITSEPSNTTDNVVTNLVSLRELHLGTCL